MILQLKIKFKKLHFKIESLNHICEQELAHGICGLIVEININQIITLANACSIHTRLSPLKEVIHFFKQLLK